MTKEEFKKQMLALLDRYLDVAEVHDSEAGFADYFEDFNYFVSETEA